MEAGGDPPLEVRGQGPEPEWRTHPSPDSACSEGSTGSLEQQQDTGKNLGARGHLQLHVKTETGIQEVLIVSINS